MKHLHDPPPSASSRGAKVPEEVELLLQKLLAKSPRDRPRSAESARHLLSGLHPTGAPKRLELSLPPLTHTQESLNFRPLRHGRRGLGVRGILAAVLALIAVTGTLLIGTQGMRIKDRPLPRATPSPSVTPEDAVTHGAISELDPTTLEARIALLNQSLRTAPLEDTQRKLAANLLHQTEEDLGGTPDAETLKRVSSRLDELEQRFLR
jgi:hypothetical protein